MFEFIKEYIWWLLGVVILYWCLFCLLSYAQKVDYENYIQLCVDNGYTNKHCEMRYTELRLTTRYEPDINVGTGIVRWVSLKK